MSDIDVHAAAARLHERVRRTPLLPLTLSEAPLEELYVKPESLQLTGSFKVRGATNFLASLPEAQRRRGVVAHSSGNHAQGVAHAAATFGVPATVVIPEGASDMKVRGAEALGARVVRCRDTQADREGTAAAIASDTGATLLPPFDDPRVIEGQGTVGLEVAQDLPRVANVIVPIGGGGLSAGVCLALADLAPQARVIGVEPALAADARDSLRRGERVSWPAERTTATMADGVRTQTIGELNFAVLREHLAGVATVEEDEIAVATRFYATRAKLVVEPTGALSLAAYLRLRREAGADGIELADGPTVVIASGGNVDAARLCEVLTAEGL